MAVLISKVNLHLRLILGGSKTNGSLRPPNLKSLMPHHGLRAVALEQPLGVGMASGTHIPKTGEDEESPKCLGTAPGSVSGHIFSMTSPNIKQSIKRKLLDSNDSKIVFCLRTEQSSEILHTSKRKREV